MGISPKRVCTIVLPCPGGSSGVAAQGNFSFAAAFLKFGAVELL